MNITPSFFVIAAAYVVTVVIILYWTFKDKIMKPVWGRLVAAIAAFAAVAVGGSMGYVIFGPDSYVQPFITVVTAFGCFFIPYIVLDYNLGQCLFISGVVKCYADDIALLATSLYYLVSDDLPEEYMDFPLWPVLLVTAVTFPLIMLFYRKLVRPALDSSGFLKFWSYIWLIPFMVNTMYAFFMQPVFTVVSDFPGEKAVFVPYMWVVLTFGAYVILTLALLGQSQNAQLQEGLHISETQINAQQKQLENLQTHISETSKLRHDMRHHLLAIKWRNAFPLWTRGIRACGAAIRWWTRCSGIIKAMRRMRGSGQNSMWRRISISRSAIRTSASSSAIFWKMPTRRA